MYFLPVILRFSKGGGGGTLSNGYIKAIKRGRKKLTKLHKEFNERLDPSKPVF